MKYMNEKNIFSKRLKALRKGLSMTQDELAARLHLSRGSISMYESGLRDPDSETLMELSRIFGISIDYLLGSTNDTKMNSEETVRFIDESIKRGISSKQMPLSEEFLSDLYERIATKAAEEALRQYVDKEANQFVPLGPMRLIPILGVVRAGDPMYAQENIEGYIDIPADQKGDYFALRIVGDSMIPNLTPGSIVVVRKQSTVDNATIAVVAVDGENATVKKVYISETHITLVALNPLYEPIIQPPSNVRILGRVVEVRTKI